MKRVTTPFAKTNGHIRSKAMVSAAALCMVVMASSCGIKGDLKTPPPVFGADKAAKPLPTAPTAGAQISVPTPRTTKP